MRRAESDQDGADALDWTGSCLVNLLPKATSWPSLGKSLERCIRKKEQAVNEVFSYPQSYFGAQTKDLSLLAPAPKLDGKKPKRAVSH